MKRRFSINLDCPVSGEQSGAVGLQMALHASTEIQALPAHCRDCSVLPHHSAQSSVSDDFPLQPVSFASS